MIARAVHIRRFHRAATALTRQRQGGVRTAELGRKAATMEVSRESEKYEGWSNDALVSHVTNLEKQLRDQNKNLIAARNASRASSPSRLRPSKKRKARNGRVFDPEKYSTRYIALKIAYLGHRYGGFEAQVDNSSPLGTIEDVLWNALVKTKLIFKSGDEPLSWEGCEYSKCGRTDKGVSAFGQVIGLRVRSNRPKKRDESTNTEMDVEAQNGSRERDDFDDIHDELPYPHLLNRVMPSDVRVLAWCPHPPKGFSARFSCRQRQYRYFFTQPAWSPTPKTSAAPAQNWGMLDIEAMKIAAKKYEGLHDFRNFCKMDPARQVSVFERHIERAEIVAHANKPLGLPFTEPDKETRAYEKYPSSCVYSFNIYGTAFLWHQVRHLVAVLFLIGQGFEKPELIDELFDIEKNPGKPVYEMTDDRPLVLWDCIFPASDRAPMKDSLHWVYPGDQKPTSEKYGMPESFGEGRYGPYSINESTWENWHSTKIDEILSGELLNIAQNLPAPRAMYTPDLEIYAPRAKTARQFDGGGLLRSKGQYIPVMKRDKLQSPEVLNARWRENNKEKIKAKAAARNREHVGEADE